jgi:O-antigen/teichoic acid export membrane protein
MALGKQFGREASIYLVGFAGVGLIQFFALPVYSRALGPAGYGLLSLTTATTALLAGVMVVGGDVALARFWVDARTQREQRQLASTWILFLTAWSVVVALVALAAVPLLAEAMRPGTNFATLLVVGVAALIPAQLSRMLAQVLRNSFRPVAYSAMLVLNAALDVAFALVFVLLLDLGVLGILLGLLVGETCGAIARLPLVKPFIGTDFDWSLLPPLLKFGLPFIPASLAAWVLRAADRVALGTHVTAEELGYYGLAVSLVLPLTLVTGALGQAWIPRIAQIDAADRSEAGKATSVAIGWSLAGLGGAAMAAGALAPLLIAIVGGPEYAESASVLPLLALGAALAGVGLFTGTGLTLRKATWVIPIVTAAAAVLDIVMLVVLVPSFGLIGAAASVVLAYFALAVLTLLFANHYYPIQVAVVPLGVLLVTLSVQTVVAVIRPSELVVWVVTIAALLGVAGMAYLSGRAIAR